MQRGGSVLKRMRSYLDNNLKIDARRRASFCCFKFSSHFLYRDCIYTCCLFLGFPVQLYWFSMCNLLAHKTVNGPMSCCLEICVAPCNPSNWLNKQLAPCWNVLFTWFDRSFHFKHSPIICSLFDRYVISAPRFHAFGLFMELNCYKLLI